MRNTTILKKCNNVPKIEEMTPKAPEMKVVPPKVEKSISVSEEKKVKGIKKPEHYRNEDFTLSDEGLFWLFVTKQKRQFLSLELAHMRLNLSPESYLVGAEEEMILSSQFDKLATEIMAQLDVEPKPMDIDEIMARVDFLKKFNVSIPDEKLEEIKNQEVIETSLTGEEAIEELKFQMQLITATLLADLKKAKIFKK